MNDQYNGWAVKMTGIRGKQAFAKYKMFAKNKRGHDDEVNRVRVFRSRENARAACGALSKRYPKAQFDAVKVFVSVHEMSDDATKALISV